MRSTLPRKCASPDCWALTASPSRLCTTCRQRLEAQFAAKDALGDAMARQGRSTTACDDQWAEERADIIGQNGPTGDHYPRQPDTDRLYEIAIELMKSATEAYQQALVLMQKGKHSDGQLLQLWANTLRTAGEQVGDEAIRLEDDA